MGITKRPASNCSEEIIPVEIDELVDNTTVSDYSDDESENDESITSNLTLIDSTTYYRSLYPELMLSHEANNDNKNNDTKSVAFKKKNISQMGRKKANRASNESFLLSLNSDQLYHPEDNIFYNENKNGFTKAINKLCTKPNLKELFIEGNDELVLQKNKKHFTINLNNDKKTKRSICPNVAFKNLTTSQKSLFKQKSLPISAIDYLETEVVRYFSLVPNGIYKSEPLPSYHRVLLHSIVRYYSLDATSVNNRGRRAQKIVQVRNSYFDDFRPPRMSLVQFISK